MKSLRVGIDGRAFWRRRPRASAATSTGSCPALRVARGTARPSSRSGGCSATCPPASSTRPSPAHPPTNLGWTLVGLPLAARRARVDLLHAPAYTAPCRHPRRPVVVTIHDVSYERHPEWYPYRRDWLRRAFYRRERAIGGASRHRLGVLGGRDSGRLRHCPRSHRGGAARRRATVCRRRVRSPRTMPSPFVLHVGDLHAAPQPGGRARCRRGAPAHGAGPPPG